MDIYYSSDFQCPISGLPVMLLYDEERCAITAEIVDWMIQTYEDKVLISEQCIKDTEEWCKNFYKYAETFDEANEIAEKYDCWF